MTGWLAKLTVTPLLWACGLLLVVAGVLGVRLHMQGASLDVANAKLEQVTTERSAWKDAAGKALAANQRWQDVHARMSQLLKEAQGEARRLGEEGEAAVASAQAQADDANRTLDAWTRKYADQVRVGTCAAALNAVQQACPALDGY